MKNTVKVTNVSLRATKREIQDFFSFSGDIESIDLKSDTEDSQVAYVTFKDPQALDTALLLSGATIVDKAVNISPADGNEIADSTSGVNPPPYMEKQSIPASGSTTGEGSGSAINKAQDVMTSMLAKGFVLGKDAMTKAKAFDEKHGLTANATAKVVSMDKKIGLTEKIAAGTTAVNERVKSVDEKYQVSEKTKSAFAAAEEKVNTAGSALMKNRYILTGASWVTGAFSRVTKAAEDVALKSKEKVGMVEGNKSSPSNDSFQPSVHEPAAVALNSAADSTTYSSLPRYDSGFSSQPLSETGEPNKAPPSQGHIL